MAVDAFVAIGTLPEPPLLGLFDGIQELLADFFRARLAVAVFTFNHVFEFGLVPLFIGFVLFLVIALVSLDVHLAGLLLIYFLQLCQLVLLDVLRFLSEAQLCKEQQVCLLLLFFFLLFIFFVFFA